MITPVRIPIVKRPQGYFIRWYYNGWHYWQFLPGGLTLETKGEVQATTGKRTITIYSGPLTKAQVDGVCGILKAREVYIYTNSGWALINISADKCKVYDLKFNGYELRVTATVGSRLIHTTGFSPVIDVPVVPPSQDFCEVTIGNQTWMCKNWDSQYPGSKVYNDDEANRALYGGLYTYNQIMNPGFCPEGWHVPTQAEWDTLIAFINDLPNAGGILKKTGTVYWDSPNEGAVDTYSFSQRGSGYYGLIIGGGSGYGGLKTVANLWTSTPYSDSEAYFVQMGNETAGISIINLSKSFYFAVRLIKDTPAPDSIIIGTQEWKMRNVDLNIAGSKVYDDNEANRAIYGGLYTYAMIAEIEAANPGWHVPTYDDLMALLTEVSGSSATLKEAGLTHWTDPNGGATNTTGFTALPGGIYGPGVGYYNINDWAFFMYKNDPTPSQYAFTMLYANTNIGTLNDASKTNYVSVRLIKD